MNALLTEMDKLLNCTAAILPDVFQVTPEELDSGERGVETRLRSYLTQLQTIHDGLQNSHQQPNERTEQGTLVEPCDPHRLDQSPATAQKAPQLLALNHAMMEATREGILCLDHTGRINSANSAAERSLGGGLGQLLGMCIHEFLDLDGPVEHDGANTACPYFRMLVDQAAGQRSGAAFSRLDSSAFPIEYTCRPIDAHSPTSDVILAFRDVTESSLLKAQLKQSQRLEAIGQLASGVAHEINTPTQYVGDNLRFLGGVFEDLAPVLKRILQLQEAIAKNRNCTEHLISIAEAAEQADLAYFLDEIPVAVKQATEGVDRVTSMVRSMKEFAHPETSGMKPVDINKAVESALNISRNEWKYVANAITNLQLDLPPVTCYPGECSRVLVNLIVNAAHAIADKQKNGASEMGTITIGTRGGDGRVEIRVQDTGVGIPDEHRSKIFEPFFTTKESGRGTGQGLTIARECVEQVHGGTLDIESVVGEGTTFIIRLPLQPASASEGEAQES